MQIRRPGAARAKNRPKKYWRAPVIHLKSRDCPVCAKASDEGLMPRPRHETNFYRLAKFESLKCCWPDMPPHASITMKVLSGSPKHQTEELQRRQRVTSDTERWDADV